MNFMIEETTLLAGVLNFSQGGGQVATVFSDHTGELHANMQATDESLCGGGLKRDKVSRRCSGPLQGSL